MDTRLVRLGVGFIGYLSTNNSKFAVIGDHMNRRVAIHSIHDGNMGTLADFRRGDIFQRNETLSAFIKISNCEYRNSELREIR